MTKLVKGAKTTFGWSIVSEDRSVMIPPDAWKEYGFRDGEIAVFIPGSKRSGGFGISTTKLVAEAREKMNGAGLHELGQSIFDDSWVVLPPEVDAQPDDWLLTVLGSCYGLGFVARGPIFREAAKNGILEVFVKE